MRLVGLLLARFKAISAELAKFGTIGLINLVINFAVFNLLLVTMPPNKEVWAKGVAAIVATTCAYFMNRHWTYRDRPKSTLSREYTLFFVFNAVGFAMETGLVAFTKYVLNDTHPIALNISTFIGIGLGTIFRFWAYRTHVFKLAPDEELAPVPVQVAAAMADSDAPPVHELDELANVEAVAPVSPAVGTRIVVTSVADGTVVLKILEGDEPIDEIALDGRVTIAADQPAT